MESPQSRASTFSLLELETLDLSQGQPGSSPTSNVAGKEGLTHIPLDNATQAKFLEEGTCTPSTFPGTAPAGEDCAPSKYMMSSGLIEFKIGEIVYRVHRDVLYPKSSVIRAMVDSSSTGEASVCRLDIDDPNITTLDFQRLIDVIYPDDWTRYSATTVGEWTSVLHLASRWNLESIRSLSISQLHALASPIDKIVLGRRYDIQSWLVNAYIAVCTRGHPLTLDEAKRFELDEVVKIAGVQFTYTQAKRVGYLRPDAYTSTAIVESSMSESDVEQLVEKAFLVGRCNPHMDVEVLAQALLGKQTPQPAKKKCKKCKCHN